MWCLPLSRWRRKGRGADSCSAVSGLPGIRGSHVIGKGTRAKQSVSRTRHTCRSVIALGTRANQWTRHTCQSVIASGTRANQSFYRTRQTCQSIIASGTREISCWNQEKKNSWLNLNHTLISFTEKKCNFLSGTWNQEHRLLSGSNEKKLVTYYVDRTCLTTTVGTKSIQ
jgi:hypothetical protein